MVASLQGHEMRAGYAGCHASSFLERLYGIVAAMQDQRRDPNVSQKSHDVYLVQRPSDAHGVLGGRCHALQVVEPMCLLRGCIRDEQGREDLSKCGILLTPPLPHEGQQRIRLLDLARLSAPTPAARIPAI